MKRLKNGAGFTLLELLVIIGIIALITTFAVVTLDKIRLAGRNTKRRSDLAQIAKAIELYKLNNDGSFPDVPAWFGGPEGGITASTDYAFIGFSDDDWHDFLETELPNMPVDPLNGKNRGGGMLYMYMYMYLEPNTPWLNSNETAIILAPLEVPKELPPLVTKLCLLYQVGALSLLIHSIVKI